MVLLLLKIPKKNYICFLKRKQNIQKNKITNDKKGSLVAIIVRTKADEVIEHLSKIDYQNKLLFKEIILDMANSIKLIVLKCFAKPIQVTDRFDVQKLALREVRKIDFFLFRLSNLFA